MVDLAGSKTLATLAGLPSFSGSAGMFGFAGFAGVDGLAGLAIFSFNRLKNLLMPLPFFVSLSSISFHVKTILLS